jgi:hypothetical protein
MIAPLFAFEKSYSALIRSAFLSRRTASRDQAVLLRTLRVDNHEQLAQVPEADCNVPALAESIRIFHKQRKRIFEYTLGIGEPDAVFPNVRSSFRGVIPKPLLS